MLLLISQVSASKSRTSHSASPRISFYSRYHVVGPIRGTVKHLAYDAITTRPRKLLCSVGVFHTTF